jgi:transposase
MEWVACVGIDWGGQEHAYAIRTAAGETSAGTMKSAPEQVHEWALGLRKRFPNGTVVVAVEHGCWSLLHALSAYEYLALVPINPRGSKAYRESLRLSGASSDPRDAELLCGFVMKHLEQLRIWQPEDAQTRKLRILVERRRNLVDQRTAWTHMLAATLKEYFPQALQWLGGESSPVLRAIIGHWSTLEQLRTATEQELIAMLRAHGLRKAQARARHLIEQLGSAVALTRDAAIIEAHSMYAQSLVALLDPLEAEIAKYDREIAAEWDEHPDRDIFASLPGAGPVLAPRLAVAFGIDRGRYNDAAEMQCYSGIAPVIEQSSGHRWVHARWGFPTFLHQTFHEFAQASIPHSSWAKAVYQEHRECGADHHEAIRALAFRWIRILFRLWENHLPYDENRHLQELKKHQSPILRRLAA